MRVTEGHRHPETGFRTPDSQSDPQTRNSRDRKYEAWVNVHTPGSGAFFGANSQPLAEMLTPKNVPDLLSLQGE